MTALSKTGTLMDFTDVDKEYQLISILIEEPQLCEFMNISEKIFTSQSRKDIFDMIRNNYMGSGGLNVKIFDAYLLPKGYSEANISDELTYITKQGYIPSWHADNLIRELQNLREARIAVTTAQRIVERAYNGEPANLAMLAEAVQAIQAEKIGYREKDFYTAEEVGSMKFDPIPFLIDDLLPPGLSFLAGRPKAGKSWLALQIAYCVATGSRFAGKNTRKGNVTYYALEDSLRRLNWRIEAQNWECSGLGNIKFILSDDFIDLNQVKIVADLTIIDTFTRATGTDQVDPVVMRNLLSPLQALAISQNKCILVIDHMPKGKGRDTYNNVIYDLYGSISKAGIADTILGLYRDDDTPTGKLSGTGRDISDFDLDLVWDKDCFMWSTPEPGKIVDKLGYSDNRHALLQAIVEAEDISQLDLAAVTGLNKGTVSRTLNELVQSGYVLKYVDGKRILYQPSVTGRVDILPMWEGKAEAAGKILQGVMI